jgi:hypothetical protein
MFRVRPADLLSGCVAGLSLSSKEVQDQDNEGAMQLTPSSYPLTWEIYVQTVMDNVKKMNKYTAQLKNRIAVTPKLQKSTILQHV